MALQFLKGKQKPPPINRVRELSSKGFSETEIIDILRKEGYSPAEIDLALSQVLKESIEKSLPKEEKQQIAQQPQSEIVKKLEEAAQSAPLQTSSEEYQINWDEYFDYIDYLIQNRINEVSNQIKIMEERYQNLQRKIEEIVGEIKNQKIKEEEIKNEISRNFSNLEKTIRDLSIKIESMEEILREVLPTLIDSVRTLNSLLNSIAKK
ncbi:MAG: hypothetical protein QXD89_01130 [Candidatus Aenigmatarchaeota archaeon]